MKSSTLAFALGALVLSSGVCMAQEADRRTVRPQPQVPTLQCCQCIGGKSIAPPPLNLSTGTVQWTVNGGQPTYVITSPESAWVNLPPAKWIQSVNSPSPGGVGAGPFGYATTFGVSKCAIPFTAVQLNGTYAADNGATITMIPPGTPPTSTCTVHTYPHCFKAPGESFSFIVPPVPPAPFLRTLNVSVTNQVGTVSGLLVNATLDARCPACSPPGPICAKPPPATNYDVGSTNTNNVPLNLCYKNTVGECLYNFAVPGTPGGWNTGCPAAVAGNNCCGWSSPVCDREIKKTVMPSPAQSGQPVTVTLTVTNVGAVACPVAGGINVADSQPPGLTFQTPAANKPGWSCGFSGPGVIAYCTSTSPLLPGSANAVTITFAANVTAAAGAKIKNCAEVTNVGDANQANNNSCVTVEVK